MSYPMHTWTCACQYKHVDAHPGLRCACGRTWSMDTASADELVDYYHRACGESPDMARRAAASVIRLREEMGERE